MNFLVIVLDDVGVDKMSSYAEVYDGGAAPSYVPETPVVDDLITHGLRFTDAWAEPTCSPSRATLQTGESPHETGIGYTPSGSDGRSISGTLLPTALSGYSSGLFGKWGLGDHAHPEIDWTRMGAQPTEPYPAVVGYSTYVGYTDALDDYDDWIEVRWPERYRNQTVTALDASTTYIDDELYDRAADFVTSQSGPWLAMVTLKTAHADSGAPQVFGWESDDLPSGWSCSGCSQQEMFQTLIESADAKIGDFLSALYAADPTALEDTQILIVGDNGTMNEVLEGGFLTTAPGKSALPGKGSVYESGIHVPMIWVDGCDWTLAQAGSTSACTPTVISPGRDVDVPVSFADVLPTLTDLAGSPVDTRWGTSLADCLVDVSADCGVADLPTRLRLAELYQRSTTSRFGGAKSGELALRRGDFKLVARQERSKGADCLAYEFYDLSTDPFEANDLYVGAGVVSADQAEYDDLAHALVRLPNADDGGWIPRARCD